MAHSPTCSTPTERGRVSSSEFTSNGLQIGGFERLGRYRWCALNQLSGNALRFPLDLFRTGKQCGLAFEQLLDPRA